MKKSRSGTRGPCRARTEFSTSRGRPVTQGTCKRDSRTMPICLTPCTTRGALPPCNQCSDKGRSVPQSGGRTGLPPPPPPAPYRLPALTRPPAAWRSAARSAQRGPIPPPSEGAGRSGAELAAARAPGGRGGEGGAPPRGGRQRGAALVVRLTRVAQAG